MGFRKRVRERLSTSTLRRKSTVHADTTSTKTQPLGRTRTNSSASIPEQLRHTRSIPASLKTLFTGHSRANTETSTLGHRASTVGGSSVEAESPAVGQTPTEETAAGVGAAVHGKEPEASTETQGDRQEQQVATAEEAPKVEEGPKQVYPESEGRFSQSPPWANRRTLTGSTEAQNADEQTQTVRPVIGSPVRSQPQEAHSYPRERSTTSTRPLVSPRKASESKTKDAVPEERSRGLDVDDVKPSVGLKMKLKLAWMGLKMKAKL